jgi:HEAT repeat protein
MSWADEGWPAVLERWHRAARRHGKKDGIPVMQPSATEKEIAALEGRLGRRLPPSYRSFLLTTNGLSITGTDTPYGGLAFLPIGDVKPAKDYLRLWLALEHLGLEGLFDIEGSMAEHLLQADAYPREGHFLYAIKINGGYPEFEMFLDPLDVDADGEWRVLDRFKETDRMHRSFGDMIDADLAAMERPDPPAFYKYVQDPSPAAEERLRLEAGLEQGGELADRAIERLVALVTTAEPTEDRYAALWALIHSKSPAAREAALRLVESRPDLPFILGIVLSSGIVPEHRERLRKPLSRLLREPNGTAYANRLMLFFPELVEEVWRETGDPAWLQELLTTSRPETLEATISALADPSLPDDLRASLTYTLGHRAGSHPPHVDAVRRLTSVAKNNRFDLACALLGWGQVDAALSIVSDDLEQATVHANYFFFKLNELAPASAVPVLIASLRRKPTADVVHTLSLIDHPDTVSELARLLDGEVRPYALLGLEQLGTPSARAALADRSAAGDLEAARALARLGDERALSRLVNQVQGPGHRSAVTGLRDLRHAKSEALLGRIAADDVDDNVAVIAAHGLVMMRSALARTAAEALRQRQDPHVKKLAKHWLALLPA